MPSKTLIAVPLALPMDRDYLKGIAASLDVTLAEFVRTAINDKLCVMRKRTLHSMPAWGSKRPKSPNPQTQTRRQNMKAAHERFLENKQRPGRKHHPLDDEDPGGYGGETTDNHGAY